MTRIKLIPAVVLYTLLACALPGLVLPGGLWESSPLALATPATAELVLRNGRVYTVAPGKPWAEAVAMRGGVIVAVGSDAEIAPYIGPRTVQVDAGGRLVLPGLIDSHIHFLSGSLSLTQLRLEGAGTIAEIQQRLRDYAASHPDGWITGRGWVYSTFGAYGLPDKKQLDEIVPDRPVLLEGYDGHTYWANSQALAAAGITRNTPDPPNGAIVHDATGEPTGALKEDAAALVEKFAPQPSREAKLAALRAGLAEAARYGLTSVVNATGGIEEMELYSELERRGQLTLRTYTAMPLRAGATEKDFMAYERARQRFRTAFVRGGLVKGFVDGVIEAHTAAMLEPYSDDPSLSGHLNYEPAELKRLVMELDRRGLQVVLHAIGDAGVRTALDAYQAALDANQKPDRRFRIEHIETVSAVDIPRFARLGVIAGYQPLHANPDDNLFRIWARNAGPERVRRAFAWREVSQAGGRLALGSDWPVVTQNPFAGIQAALTRQTFDGQPPGGWTTHQTLTLEQAIAGYTTGGAHAQRREKELGSIEVGKQADLVVLTANLFVIAPQQIHSVRAHITVVAGKVVHRAAQ